MVENLENKRKPGDVKNEDIIELSEMTVGISQEDEAIINLTEEIVEGAFEGYSRMTGEIRDEEEMLDLSFRGEADQDQQLAPVKKTREELPGGLMDIEESTGDGIDSIESDIARELDNYFQLEEETKVLLNRISSPKTSVAEKEADRSIPGGEDIAVTHDRFEAALEEVIRKMFGEKIDRILNEVIERTVNEEIEELKEVLVRRVKRPD